MLGLGSSLLQGGALRSIVRSGLQLFYKADETQAPLGEEQVRNNSFDEISGNLVSNPTFDLGSEEVQNGAFNLGSEKVQNGDFSDGTTLGWSFVNLTADISNNTLKLTSTTSADNRAFYNISTEIGKTYQMSVDVKSSASNSISGIGGIGTTNPSNFQDGANANSFTTLKFVFTATLETTEIRLLNSKAGVWGGLGSIAEFDNVSVKEVTNWELGSSWSVANNVATLASSDDATDSTLTSSATLVSSKTYILTYTISNYVSGELALVNGNVSIPSTNGNKTFTFTGQTELSMKRKGGATALSISNISVKEVPNWVLSSASVSDNKCTMTSVGGALTYFYQSGLNLTQDKSYNISFKATRISGDTNLTFNRAAGNNISGAPTISNTNEYSFNFTPSQDENGFGLKRFANGSGAVWEIENFSVKQLDPNNRWVIVNPDTSAHTVEIREGETYINYDHDGGTQDSTGINQSGVFPNTTSKYEVELELGEVTGQLKVQARGISTTINSSDSNTTKVILLDSSSDDQTHIFIVRLENYISGSAFVKNVSVKEITNSIKDHSKNSNDGILYSGKALNFDGSGDGVQLDTARDISILGDYTIAFWFKRNNTSNSLSTIYHNSKNGDNRTGVHWTDGNKITFNSYSTATNYQGVNSLVLDKDEWYRVVAVAKGGVKTLYINNENNPTFSGSISSYLPGSGEFLGGSAAGTNCDGAVADFQLYYKAWNATDVKYDWENPDKDVFDRVGEAQVLGEELVDNGDFSDGETRWNIASDGWNVIGERLNVDTDDGSGVTTQSSVFEIGKTYVLTLDASLDVGEIKFESVEGDNFIITSSDTTISHTFVADDARILLRRNAIPTRGYIDNISIKEIITHASHILPTDCKSLLRLNEGAGDRVYDAAPVLGAEEVQNGTFNLGSEIADNNTINNNGGGVITKLSDLNYNATSDGTSSSTIKPRILPTLTLNKTYKIVVTPRNQSGTIRFNIYDGAKYLLPWVDGFTEPIVVYLTKSGNTPFFSFNGQNTFNLDFTLSVKEIPNWELDSDWSVANNTAIYVGDGTAKELLQEISFIGGRTYEIKIDVASISGSLKARFNNYQANKAVFNQTGIQTLYITASGSGNITDDLSISRETGIVSAVLNSVSVKEIKPAESFAIVGDKNFIHQQPYIPQYAMSSFSKKMLFDGVNDYVTGSFNGNIGPAKDMTFSCWFSYEDSVTAQGDRETLFGLMSSSGDGLPFNKLDVSIFETNKITVFTGDGTNYSTSNSTQNSLVKNKLNHVAVSVNDYDASNGVIRIYINGVLDTTTTRPYYGAPDISHYRIGSRSSSSQLSKGIIDEVSLFKSELTQDEVLELYNSGSAYNSNNYLKQFVNFHSSGLFLVASNHPTYPVAIQSSNSISFDDTLLDAFGLETNNQSIYSTLVDNYDDSYGVPLLPVGSKVNISGRITANDGSGSLYNDVDNDGYISIYLSNSENELDIGIHTSSSKNIKVDSQGYFSFTHTIVNSPANRLVIAAHDIGPSDVDTGVLISELSITSSSLVGYWRNNGADQWDDLSINSNHGTVSGSPTEIFLQEVPFFDKDSLGMFMNKPRLGGLNFNGSGYVANESMPTISDNISFSFWIKLEGFVSGNLAQIVGKRKGGAGGDSRWCRVYRPLADTLRLEVTGSDRLDFTISEAEWVHVVTTIDENNLAKAYVNGALDSQATLNGGFNFLNANDFSIGAWKDTATSTSGTSLLNGVVDDVMVYDETLTLKQVKRNYNATKGKHKN